MTTTVKQFLLIDDDPINNFITMKTLKTFFKEAEVKDFVVPEKGLEYIESEFKMDKIGEKATIFLDINMPTLTGWEFLDKFKTFTEPVKKQFNIYMLSSSLDPGDIQRAKLNSLVMDFIEKPINITILTKMFGVVV